MIEAFKSTLEELTYANQLLLILDVSQPIEDISKRFNSCIDVLIDLGVSPDKVFLVFNKSDMVDEVELKSKLSFPGVNTQSSVFISAKTGFGIEELLKRIKNDISESTKDSILIKKHEIASLSTLIDWLKSQGKVEITKQNGGNLMLNLSTKSWVLDRFSKAVKEIREKEE
jgi:GTP-binding protein HflX